jgi:hypothetical protein
MKLKTPMKAIRAKCLDCTCNQLQDIRECTIKKCPLYPYRMGRRPTDKEIIEYEKIK